MSLTFNQLARPGSRFEGIAQKREQQFNNDYFNNLYELSEGNQLSHDFYGNVSFEGSASSFPTLEEAWNSYRTAARNKMMTANYSTFKQQYDQINNARHAKSVNHLKTAGLSGVTDKSIRDLASKNPEFHKHLVNISATNPQLGAQLLNFMPQKKFSQQFASDPSLYLGLGGAAVLGGTAAANYLGQVDPKGFKENFEKYKTTQSAKMTPALADARTSKKALDAAIKSKNPARIKAAQYRYDQAYKKMRSARKGTTMPKTDTRWNKMMGGRGYKGVGFRMGAFMAGPMILQKAITGATGNEKVGEIAGTSTQAAIGVKFSIDALKRKVSSLGAGKVGMFLLRKAPGLAAKIGVKAGAGIVGGSFTGGALTAAMAAWTVADLVQVMKLLNELE